MASKDAADKKDSSMKCPVCRDDLQEPPRSLPCKHSMCVQCLTQHVSASASADKTFPCPTCGTKCKVTDEGVVEVDQAPLCVTTGDQAPLCVTTEHGLATAFCCDCDKFFCEMCHNNHQLCDWMIDHTQRPVEEMSFFDIKYAQSGSSGKICPEHELPLSILCKTCEKVICHTCLRYKHKDHGDRELSESTSEAKKSMKSMTDEAKKVINKQHDALKEAGQTKETIREDVKKAKESVKTAAQQICDTIRKHEKNLLDELDRSEEEAIRNLELFENNVKARKADAISLQKEISSLLQFGKPIEQVERTPVLQENFDAQQKVEAESMTWKYVCERKEFSEESVKSMLGDVKLVTPTITLRKPLQQVPLKYTGDRVVSGMVVVGDCLCVVHSEDPHIWLYDIANSQSNACVVPHLKDPRGMALVNPADRTVIITDQNTESGVLHFVRVSTSLDITHLTSKKISLKQPGHVSVYLDNTELLIGQEGGPEFLVCDLQGNAQRLVTVLNPDGTERLPYCVQRTASGYAAVMWDKDQNSIIQWLGQDGACRQTYGQNDGELIKRGQHMVSDSAGQLIVVDLVNSRLHLVDSSGCHVQFLLTKDDGIERPQYVYLDEAAGRMYVSHRNNGPNLEVRVYKWPPKSGEFRLQMTVANC